jgi:colanic acid/amylovoran biosynthesis protein
LAIALSQLNAMREHIDDVQITLLCRQPVTDAHWFEKADDVQPELFAIEPQESFIRRLRRVLTVLMGIGYDRKTKQVLQCFKASDALVFCGGGSPGGYGIGNLILHAICPAILAGRAKLPTCFLAHGIPVYQSVVQRLLHAALFKRAALVTVRDPLSMRELEKMNTQAVCKQTADWAWLLKAAPTNEVEDLLSKEGIQDSGRFRIGMNIRSGSAIDADARAGTLGEKTGSQKLAKTMSLLIEQLNAELVIVSMNQAPASDDLSYARQVCAQVDDTYRAHVHLLEGDYSPSQIKGMVAMSDLFIGTRLHPSIFAISSAVPTITLHQQAKVVGMMQMTNLEQWHIPVEEFEPTGLVHMVKKLHLSRDIVLKEQNMTVDEMQRTALANVKFFSQSIKPR